MRIVCLFTLLTIVGMAQAQERLSGSFSTEVNTDFKKGSDINKELYVSSALSFSYLFPKLFSLSTAISFDQDLQGEQKGEIKDTYINASRKIKDLNENLALSASTTVFIPISKTSTDKTFLSTGYQLKGSLGIKMPRIPNLSNSVSIGFVQNFHRSNVTISGSSNKQYTFSTSVKTSYSIWDNFSASTSFSYSKGFTYKGKIIDSYSSGQELAYQAFQKIGLGLGHGISGNLAGTRSNSHLSFFDKNKSTVYMFLNLGIF